MSSRAARAARTPAPPRRTRYGTGASGPARQVLGRELIADLEGLCGRPTVGLLDVLVDVASIALTAVLGAWLGHGIGPALAVCYIGVRQRHLSNLAHECVHGKLAAGRRANRWIGYALTALLGDGFLPYKITHGIHHAELGSARDPMFQSYLAGDIRRAGPDPTRREFVLKVIVRSALFRLPKTAVRTLVTKAPEETWRAPAARALLWGAALTLCWPLDAVGLFLLYWLVPLVLVRPVVTWITDLGNHAGLIENQDLLLQTRGWSSHWVTRHLLGGHLDDMHHPIHHLCPQIPFRRLPEATAMVRRDLDRWPEVPWCSGFFFRRRSTPDQRCVIEDIIARLAAAPARPTAPHTADVA
ncbi:fatty acid desaturase family protein [Streptomyces goshikiensis]|uniref:fatty acid desaturase family protein n=1 Tax=Streptomyces goshikiensis TaxID=1942 RepID=UPI0036AC937E